ADADSAFLHLAFGDIDTLVSLGMGPERDATFTSEATHLLEIGAKSVQFQHQTRGWQIMDFFHEWQSITPHLHRLCGTRGLIRCSKPPGNSGAMWAYTL